ncbi:MAG: hypothetical protein ABI353_07175 [Isosphaeraceae bacterium]
MLQEPAVKAEYDAHAEEFAWFDELLRARQRAGLTQKVSGHPSDDVHPKTLASIRRQARWEDEP